MTAKTITCKQCGAGMKKTTHAESNIGVQFFGCAIFIVGLVLLVFFPVGTIIGLLLMLGAARMGYKRRKVWKCVQCGYFFERG